jgi:hypothetical protein
MAYSGAYGQKKTAGETSPAEPAEEKGLVSSAAKAPQGERTAMNLQNLLKKIEAVGMETDDLILALILFLMYRESGDKDLLILLGAMLLS